jgi:Tfp pilus assembly protein PilZ
VVDLSASGMRVLTKVKLPKDESISFSIGTLDESLPVCGRVVWIKRAGFFKREAGIRFERLPEATIAALRHLARAASYNETIRQDIEAARRAG